MQVPNSTTNTYCSIATYEFSHMAFLGSNLCVF